MKSIILFRFHKNPLVVKNRLEILKKYNPELEIYGLYGGQDEDYPKMRRYLRHSFQNTYQLKPGYQRWAWLNGDLALREWFQKVGRKIEFDRLYLVEWDALIFDNLDKIFTGVPSNAVGLTRPKKIGEYGTWYWVTKEPWKSFHEELLNRVESKYKYDKSLELGCIFPLPIFPRSFLEEYSNLPVEKVKYQDYLVPLSNDEIRLPIYAQILGFDIVDNGLTRDIRYLNALPILIEESVIREELSKLAGKRVFHPYKKIFRDSRA